MGSEYRVSWHHFEEGLGEAVKAMLCGSAYSTWPSGTSRQFNVKATATLCETEPLWVACFSLSPSATLLL